MDKKEIEVLENELRKNTEILENTFESINLKVISVAYSGDINSDYVTIWIELVSIEGNKLKLPKGCSILDLKVNFYDNDMLLCNDHAMIFKDDFNGYDTVSMHINFDRLITRATRTRVYATTH